MKSKLNHLEGFYYEDIYNNWNRNLLAPGSIHTGSGRMACGEKDFSNLLIQEEWPGTVDGCLLLNSVVTIENYHGGKNDNCHEIPANDPLPLNFWRGRSFCRGGSSKIGFNSWINKTYFDIDISSNFIAVRRRRRAQLAQLWANRLYWKPFVCGKFKSLSYKLH